MYRIELCQGKTFGSVNVTSYTVTKQTTNSTISNLAEGTDYTLRIVQELTGTNNTRFVINEGAFYTFRTKQHVAKVTNLTATTIGVTSLTFTWDSALFASGYDLRFKSGNTVSMADAATNQSNIGKTYNNLTGETNYTIGVVSKGDGVNFGDSTGMTTYTVSTAQLVKHSGVTITFDSITQTSMLLKWTPKTNEGISGYTIYYSTQNTQPATPSYTISNSGTTQQQINGLAPNTTYYFWVVVVGNRVYYKNSDPDTANKSTLAPEQLPAPTLSSDGTTTSSIRVKWTQQVAPTNRHAATSYTIYYSTSPT